MAETNGGLVQPQPAAGTALLLFLLQEQRAILPAAKLPQSGELAFDAVEEVQNGLALEPQLERNNLVAT